LAIISLPFLSVRERWAGQGRAEGSSSSLVADREEKGQTTHAEVGRGDHDMVHPQIYCSPTKTAPGTKTYIHNIFITYINIEKGNTFR